MICKNDFFIFLENYIIQCIRELKNIEKDEIYLPFAIREYSELNNMEIDVISSLSKWFGITYIEDKKESIKKLKVLTENKLYPSPCGRDLKTDRITLTNPFFNSTLNYIDILKIVIC